MRWALGPDRWRSHRAFRRLYNKHAGERCFIMGNGPSLKQTDLSRLKNETTFGLNRIYLAFPEMGFDVSYLVCVNRLVLEQCAADIASLSMPKFVSWASRDLFPASTDIMYLRSVFDGSLDFSRRPLLGMWEGHTVTYVAMQLAFYMGFDKVILIGVDHSFATKGEPNKVVVSNGRDPNHFSGEYFGRGFRWQLPDLEMSEAAYRMAGQAFEADGREIVDATVGGKLEVFRKVPYDSLFD